MAGPLEQFEIHQIQELPLVGGFDLSITNATVSMLIVVGVIVLALNLATRRASMVPNRMQSVAELGYEFIAGMIRDIAGPEGMRYFPFVFCLFAFILLANMLGMFGVFTSTSHIAVTLTLAMMTFLLVIVVGIARHGFGFLRLFFPGGVPVWLYPILTPIEIISFLARPITLSVRLFANMLAGHVILKVFAGFVVSLAGIGGAVGLASALLPLAGLFAITGLEFLVAFLQAYVFAILTVIYLNDVIHMHH